MVRTISLILMVLIVLGTIVGTIIVVSVLAGYTLFDYLIEE